MVKSIAISDEIYSRLEKLAIGFDTPSNVIERLLDHFDNLSINSCTYEKLSSSNAKSVTDVVFTNKEIQERVSSIAKNLTEDELLLLCDESNSKATFGISFPLFVRVPASENETTKKEAVKASGDVPRWTWKYSFLKNGYEYAICTQWYRKHDAYVAKWLQEHGENSMASKGLNFTPGAN